MTLYEHDVRTLNRKTGISINGFEYKGPNLKYLIGKYGEVQVKILFDPEDYREIFVFDGEGEPLVALRESHARPETPAYSFSYMEAQKAQRTKPSEQDPQARKFDQDMHQHAVEASTMRKSKKMSKAKQNRSVVEAMRSSEAVERAARRPLSGQTTPSQPPGEPARVYTFVDDVPELPALSRSTGEVQS